MTTWTFIPRWAIAIALMNMESSREPSHPANKQEEQGNATMSPFYLTDGQACDLEHLDTSSEQWITQPWWNKCCTCTKGQCQRWLKVSGLVVLGLYLLGVVFINIWVNVPNRRVVGIYGDSLVDESCQSYYLDEHLYGDLFYTKPGFQTEVIDYGHSDFRIRDMREAMHKEMLHRFDYTSVFTWSYAGAPDAVILYWDSDVNPGPVDGSSPTDNNTVTAYLNDLYDVIDRFKRECKVVILSGPTLSGELPRGQNALDYDLDYYADLNNQTAILFNITYINTRDYYFANLPEGWNQTSGYLTTDGEHPNQRGSTLLRTVFRKALLASDELW